MSAAARHIVIVGAGHAGVECADALRREGHTGPLTLLDAGADLPYQRPPLTKEYLAPGEAPSPLPLRGPDWYAAQNVSLRRGVTVTACDPSTRTLTVNQGEPVRYDELVLATGVQPTRHPLHTAGVHYIATLADAIAAREVLQDPQPIVVIGSGFIALELASAARAWGCDVTVLMRGDRPLRRSVTPQLAEFLQARHEANGVRFVPSVEVREFVTDAHGALTGVVDTRGELHPTAFVACGLGSQPPAIAGLDFTGGYRVDEFLQTQQPHIWAIGDAALQPTGAESSGRIECVSNATAHARVLAKTLTGTPTAYAQVPWFWSDQAGVTIKMVGHLPDHLDAVLTLGDPALGAVTFAAFAAGRMAYVETVGRMPDHMAARRLLQPGAAAVTQDDVISCQTLKALVSPK